MPIYEFRCRKCNDQIEVYQKMSDKPPTRCRKCGGRMEKQFSRTSVQFKGDGWYVTDYARKGSVGETVDKELSAPEPSTSESSSEKATEKGKPKKDTAKDTTKKTGSSKGG